MYQTVKETNLVDFLAHIKPFTNQLGPLIIMFTKLYVNFSHNSFGICCYTNTVHCLYNNLSGASFYTVHWTFDVCFIGSPEPFYNSNLMDKTFAWNHSSFYGSNTSNFLQMEPSSDVDWNFLLASLTVQNYFACLSDV